MDFVSRSGIRAERIKAYREAWRRAAADGVVPSAVQLVPGLVMELPSAGLAATAPVTSRNQSALRTTVLADPESRRTGDGGVAERIGRVAAAHCCAAAP